MTKTIQKTPKHTHARQLGILSSDWLSHRPIGELGILRLWLSLAPAARGDREVIYRDLGGS